MGGKNYTPMMAAATVSDEDVEANQEAQRNELELLREIDGRSLIMVGG